ncbi:MAG: alpha/beta hydrolase [Candidatus Saccharibacteria bacterium]|nr:alpha/beta hydrolase [Candidatus Saccharibacteria bacterium]
MIRPIKYLLNILRPIPVLHVAYDVGDKHKQTIVLLHGIAATSTTWEILINQLGPDKYRIVALDLLGFGQSPKPKSMDYTVDDHIKSVHKTLENLRIKKPFIIIGHSMGAIVAVHYYTIYPKGIKHMYLLSPPIYIADDDSQTIFSRTRTDLYLDAYKFISEQKKFTINNSQLLRKLLSIKDGIDVNEDNWESFRLSLMNTTVKQDTYDEISKAKIPVSIIYGSIDEFLIPESVDKLAEYRHVTVKKLLAVDHIVGKRFAKEVARLITKT